MNEEQNQTSVPAAAPATAWAEYERLLRGWERPASLWPPGRPFDCQEYARERLGHLRVLADAAEEAGEHEAASNYRWMAEDGDRLVKELRAVAGEFDEAAGRRRRGKAEAGKGDDGYCTDGEDLAYCRGLQMMLSHLRWMVETRGAGPAALYWLVEELREGWVDMFEEHGAGASIADEIAAMEEEDEEVGG
jgi:hypothetical protein